jgi:hypothetical protein
MCQQCIDGYPIAHGNNHHNTFPWNDPQNLPFDPDHGWQPAPAAEVAAAQGLNAQFGNLHLVRPPDKGLGDFVSLNGNGRHFDHKTLVQGGATQAFVTDNIKVTLDGPYEPFIIIDSTGIPVPQRQVEVNNLDTLLQQHLTAAEQARIIWWPVGPNGAAPALPAAATQNWAGPPEVDASGLFD